MGQVLYQTRYSVRGMSMDSVLLIGYAVLFAVMVGMLIRIVKQNRKWWPLWLFELCAAIGAWAIMMIADAVPGTSMMPGLHNFGIVIYSMGAAVAFGVLLIISLIIGLIRNSNQA